jgi:primosomal replication protein N
VGSWLIGIAHSENLEPPKQKRSCVQIEPSGVEVMKLLLPALSSSANELDLRVLTVCQVRYAVVVFGPEGKKKKKKLTTSLSVHIVVIFFFAPLSSLGSIHLFPQQKIKNVRCPETLEVCTVGIKMCLEPPPDTSWTGNWAVKNSCFCTVCNNKYVHI